MSYPVFENKYQLDAVYHPKDIVDYRLRIGRMPRMGKPTGVLISLDRGIPHRLRRKIPIRKAGGMNGDLYMVKKTGEKVGVMVNIGGGSPIVAELAEEFVAMGIGRLILMTWGGALQPELSAGDIVVCDQAIRDEGTSYHYLPPGKLVAADHLLAASLVEAIQRLGGTCTIGTTWTTDAPYRETPEEVRQYQAEGVKTVEMESAGLFTIGKIRRIPTASVVVVMDSLATLKWKVPDKLDRIIQSLEIVYRASIDVLSKAQP